MKVFFGENKNLDIISARITTNGDIEVLLDDNNSPYSIYLTEYELEWFIVFEPKKYDQKIPAICDIESFLVKNQLDIYKLNASL